MFSYRFPATHVPAKETTYECMAIELPSDKPYHLIAAKSINSNADVVHHIFMYACAGAGMDKNRLLLCR